MESQGEIRKTNNYDQPSAFVIIINTTIYYSRHSAFQPSSGCQNDTCHIDKMTYCHQVLDEETEAQRDGGIAQGHTVESDGGYSKLRFMPPLPHASPLQILDPDKRLWPSMHLHHQNKKRIFHYLKRKHIYYNNPSWLGIVQNHHPQWNNSSFWRILF